VLLLGSLWLGAGLVRGTLQLCRGLTKVPAKAEDDAVRAAMRRVDSRNLRRISRVLSGVDVAAVAAPEDPAVRRVLRSVETRSVRKISKSLQGVDVSRVLGHFTRLSEAAGCPAGRREARPGPFRPRHVTLPEAATEEESSEETDPLSSSESSVTGSERSFTASTLIYTNPGPNAELKDINQNAVLDEIDSSKSEHEFVRFAECQDLPEVLSRFRALLARLVPAPGLRPTLPAILPALRKALAGQVPHR
jgi:hypothetical protein